MKTQRKRFAAVLLSATLTLSNLAGILPQSNVLAAEESVQTEMAQAESALSEAQPAPAAAEAAQQPEPAPAAEAAQPAPAAAAEAAQPAPAPAAEAAQPAPASAEEPATAAPAESVSTPEPVSAETPAAPQQESAAPAESQSAEVSATDTQQSASNGKLTEKEGQTAGKAETVTVYYAAAEGGSVSSASEAVQASSGQTVGSEAKAAEGFVFKNWTASDGTVVSTSAFFAPQIPSTANREYTYTAHFEKAVETPVTRMVTVEYVAGNGGTVNRGSETVDALSADAALLGSTATAQDGYRFVDWTASDNSIVSSDASFVPALSADMPEKTVYIANFKKTDTMPAQDFEGSVSGVQVSVHADEGRFPEGTTMHLAPVSKASILNNDSVQDAVGEDKEVVDAIAVDITFLNKDGKEIEPAGAISVSMSTSRDVGGESHQVLHIDDSGNASQVTDASADGASFEASEFSIYVITGTGTLAQQPAVETWNFYGADNSTILSTQSVKDGESIVSPETPEKDGYLFQGWAYTVGNAAAGTVNVSAFTTRTADVPSTRTVNLYPVFSQKLYVFFMDNYKRVWETKEGKTGDKISTSDVTLPLGSEESVTGWYTDSSLTGEAVAEVTLENSDVTLYPKVESGHYLFFSSGDGASYVAPQFVSANAVTAKPAVPTRSGYTFAGWSGTEGSDKADYEFGKKLTENTTIYAVWEANTNTKYTVIYWKQSVNNKKDAKDSEKTYDYAESDTRTGTSGQTAFPVYLDQNQNYTGFHYNSSKSVPVTINGDGTTILNVYYDRNTLTIDFYKPSGLFGSKWRLDKTFTGLYGQTLAQNGYTWPSEYNWYNSSGRNHLTFLDAFIFDTLDEYGDTTKISLYRDNSSGDITINHYKQNLDGSYSSTPTNSTKTNGGTFYFSNKYNGFTLDTYSTNGYQWKSASAGDSTPYRSNLYIRYTRNDYTLSFYNYNEVSRKEQVLYEALLSSYANYVPDRPSELSEDFQFEGWYKDPELTQKFDFDQTMPAGGITLYAKWTEPTYNGTVHLTIDGSGAATGLTIGYGATISAADMPTVVDADGNTVFPGNGKNTVSLPKDVDWIGWATKNGTQYTAFQFATQIFDDITLYPYYVSKAKYTVTYDVNGGSGTVTDGKEYASGSYADIQSGHSVTAPKGKAFLYWNTDKEGKGVSYYPGDKLLVNDNATLYAVYGDPAQTTSLAYNSNYPAGSGQTDKEKLQSVNGSETLQNNASFQALSREEAGFIVPDGYYFTGWNTAANGSGTSVAAGADILVDADGTNKLYAQWEKKKAVVLTVTGKNVIVPYDGKEHSVKGYTTAIKVDGAAATVLPGNLQLDESKAIGKTATGTDAKKYDIGLAEGDFSITGSDLEKYSVTIQVTDGWLTIQPRTVTLTSASATKAYDGTTLTAPEVTIGSLGFVKGEVTSVAAKGTQTAVGTSDNSPIEIVSGDNYKDSNYDIKYEYGTLKVTKSSAAFTIKAKDAEKTYDGTALTESGYTVTKPQGFEKFEVTAVVSGSITDAGTADNTVDSYTITDPSGNVVTGNFTKVTKVNGTLKVNPRKVTLHSQSKEKEYDGTALTAPAVTASDPAFVDGEVTDIKATGSQTKVGSSTNTISYTGTDKFKASNYNLTLDEGTLTVSKNAVKIKVTAESAEKTYDGTALTNSNYKAEGLPTGFTVSDVTVTGSATNVKDTASGNNVVTGGKILYNGEDVTDQFANIELVNGTLTILPRKVTLTSATDSKKYDGKALTNSTITEGGDKFVQGEVTDLKATGSQTEKGTSDNPISYSTVAGKFKVENYEIEEVIGTLTVYAADTELVITAPSGTWEYDGTTHSIGNNVTATWPSADDAAKYAVTATVSGSVKDVGDGTVANEIDKKSIKITEKSTGNNVTANFDTSKITTVNGTLSVYARQVTLTSESADKPYDGTALTAPSVTVSGSGFVYGEVEQDSIRATGSIVKVGSATNTIAYTTAGAFKENNYNITKNEGTLTIRQNATLITVASAGDSKTYDGTPLTNHTITTTGLPDGFTLTAEVTGSITDVDPKSPSGNNTVANAVITTKEDGKDVDVTNQFSNITYQAGTLSIVPRKVTLESKSGSKPYDGTALTAPDVTVGGDGFVDGEIAEGSIKATGSITKVGSVPNSITYKPTLPGNFDENNYEITKEEGTLSISKAEIAFRVKANSHTWTYDGNAHTDSGYTVTVPENDQKIYGKFMVEAEVTGSVTNVTEKQVANKITKVTVKKQNGLLLEDVTDQFDLDDMILENGVLEIRPVDLTLTSESDRKEYDGTPLEQPDVKTEGSIITTNGKAQISNIRATGSVTDVTTAPVPNTITYETSEDFIPENYVITKNVGTLTVTPNSSTRIVFTAKDASKTYDGTPLTEPGVEVTGLLDGFTAEAEAGGSITNVSQTVEGNNPVTSYKILDKEKKDVTDWFTNVTKTAGTLTITAREITLTSAGDKKTYDGTPLVKKEVTVTGAHGLVDTHFIEYTFTGSQTYVGSSPNTFTYTIKDKEGNVIPVSEVMPAPKKRFRAASQDSVKKGNYIITVVYGTLTVTDDVKPEQVVSKTHEGKAYQLGEQIVFEIRVTNIYDTAQTITLTEQDGVVFTGPYTFTDVEPGQTVTTSAFHVVNEDDLKNGTYTNTVKADFKEVKKTWEGTDDENQFAHLTLEKQVTNAPADGTAYMNGETIRYRITLTNDGTTALYNLNVADILTGDEWNGIEKLAPGGQLTFDTSYKVTDPDAENGFVTNQAVGNAQDGNGNFVEPQPASVRVPVQKAKPSLYLEKTSDKDKAVDLGETIHYTIHLVNNGNTTVSDIVVTDEMTGDSWNAGTLKPGEDKTFHTEYVVTEKDILAGSVKNVALADGKDPNGNKPDVTPGEEEDKTVPENAHLTVAKKTVSNPKNHSGYAVGETIRYQIEAFNDGNLTLTDVEVSDPLTGETWKVEKLAPGEKQTFETKYTVTEKDQSAGKVVNKATAKAKTPGSTKLIVVLGTTSDSVLPKAKEEVATPNAVKTGDPTQTGAYLAMLLVAAAGIVLLSRKKKEEHRK